jgi:hypothetical protein
MLQPKKGIFINYTPLLVSLINFKRKVFSYQNRKTSFESNKQNFTANEMFFLSCLLFCFFFFSTSAFFIFFYTSLRISTMVHFGAALVHRWVQGNFFLSLMETEGRGFHKGLSSGSIMEVYVDCFSLG